MNDIRQKDIKESIECILIRIRTLEQTQIKEIIDFFNKKVNDLKKE